MRPLLAVVAAGVFLATLSTTALAARPTLPGPERSCGTPEPTPLDILRARNATQRTIGPEQIQRAGGQIKVAFHVITSGAEGDVTQAQIDDQIAALNAGFRGTGYTFALASVDRTDDHRWFKMLPGTGDEKNAKRALAIDPAHRLNIYTASLGQGLVGWAYFPQSLPENHYLHGVVVHYGSLPGGFIEPYNLGGTAVHETGHYLGLFHTFQGGCTPPGDFVDDTPFEASPASGCPIGRNTCPAPGDDPIHNYMDYTDDACYTEFTAGQDARMDAIVSVYRPSLLGRGALALSGGDLGGVPAPGTDREIGSTLELRGGIPNPFSDQAELTFVLSKSERVSLAIYNIAGQLVHTLVDADLPPGEHRATLSARGLRAGMYFAVVRTREATRRQSVILVH